MGRGVTIRDSAYGTHKPAAEVAHLSRVHIIDHHHAVALRHGVRHALGQALVVLALYHKTVHHQFDVVVAVAVNPHPLHHFLNLAVHSHIKVAFAADRLEEFLVVSLSVLHLGRKQIDLVALVVLQQEIQDLLFGIFYHFLSRGV